MQYTVVDDEVYVWTFLEGSTGAVNSTLTEVLESESMTCSYTWHDCSFKQVLEGLAKQSVMFSQELSMIKIMCA